MFDSSQDDDQWSVRSRKSSSTHTQQYIKQKRFTVQFWPALEPNQWLITSKFIKKQYDEKKLLIELFLSTRQMSLALFNATEVLSIRYESLTKQIKQLLGKSKYELDIKFTKPDNNRINSLKQKAIQMIPPSQKFSCRLYAGHEIDLPTLVDQQPLFVSKANTFSAGKETIKSMTPKEYPQLEKKRGVFLYGQSNSGKTTIAKHFFASERKIYIKSVQDKRVDDFNDNLVDIFIDDLPLPTKNVSSGQIIPFLKDVCNIIPFRADKKYGSATCHFETIVVTSQYLLHELTDDRQLIEAIRNRYRFYAVERTKGKNAQHRTLMKQFEKKPGDLQAPIYSLLWGTISFRRTLYELLELMSEKSGSRLS